MKRKLSNTRRKELKKKAYSLKPIIIIGQKGLTDAVIAEIDSALDTHELIKIRIRGADKDERTEQCLKIEQQLSAHLIQQIGFINVFYRLAPSAE